MIQFKTPKGIAGVVCLATPDTRFDPKGTYRVDLTLNAAEAAPIFEACRKEGTSVLGLQNGETLHTPSVQNADGTVTLKFRSHTRPNVYDARSNLIGTDVLQDLDIGSGSILRVSGKAEAYRGFGGGVTLYLLEVQLIHLEGAGFAADPDGTFLVR
ncbi:hypothetical protein AWB73_05285 [Caballeronia turbans]|nr:hypothetical protein AWB73_05285 [Caballeronia turbans]